MPESIRSLDTLENPDYADIVTGRVCAGFDRSPEQWFRAALDGIPGSLRRAIPTVHRRVLGFRLDSRPGPDRLLGWKITGRGENWIRLETASWFLAAHVILHADKAQLSLAAFVRYERPLARVVWPPVSLIHRQAALALVRSAVRSQ